MTTIYFVRHAESDNNIRDGRIRPLTEKGMKDRELVTEYLKDKKIDYVLSSPYKRAVDTVSHFAREYGFDIHTIENFRERESGSNWLKDANLFSFIEKQWQDFNYTLSDGETLNNVKKRNISALENVLSDYKGKNIVIGTHGMALSVIINYYDSSYGFSDFMDMVNKMPWIVKFIFDGIKCVSIEKIDLFT